ncbi:hypothetical protein AVEN_265650-1 [Araneus ventricosus]|uniref:Uncharacterized protein n=1 Tax=Araneus ventricosus TaxID=182803 RepID=A0A4Y2SZJ0_ARAVE|nr:hypothetical protein AVEN_265650-1 [Araneus ventricosus]
MRARSKARAIYGDLLNQTPRTSMDEASEDSFKASRGWFDNLEKGPAFTPLSGMRLKHVFNFAKRTLSQIYTLGTFGMPIIVLHEYWRFMTFEESIDFGRYSDYDPKQMKAYAITVTSS